MQGPQKKKTILDLDDDDPTLGTMNGLYHITKLIGEGRTSKVYKAEFIGPHG